MEGRRKLKLNVLIDTTFIFSDNLIFVIFIEASLIKISKNRAYTYLEL
jgi:hypothetical protein